MYFNLFDLNFIRSFQKLCIINLSKTFLKGIKSFFSMKIAVIGCGTTGNQIIPLLEGEILLVDRDIVEERNLERQPLFTKEDVGKPKALVLGEKFNLDYRILDLDYSTLSVFEGVDFIIDCTDNLETRFLINEYSVKNCIDWIYTGAVGDRGRVMKVDGEFCFRCIFSEVKGLDTCSTDGIDLEVAKEVAKVAVDEMYHISRGLWANGEWIKVRRDIDCPVCNGEYRYLEGKKEKIMQFCGSSRFQFKGGFDFELLRKRLGGEGEWFVYEDFYIFRDRILVKAGNEKEAKIKFAKVVGF
jgi:molybdopterin-synthase adenylyltransferase